MNWVDFAIIAIILLFALEGRGKSFLSEVLGLLSFIFSFIVSLKFYNIAADQLQSLLSIPYSFAKALGFIILWYLVEIVLFIVTRVGIFKGMQLRVPGSETFSVIPAGLRGFIFVSLILVLIGTFPIQPRIKSEVNRSLIGAWILNRTYAFEAPLKNIFGDLGNDTLTFLTIKPKTNESVNLGFTTNSFSFNEKLEIAMIDLVNQERAKEGIKTLTVDLKLRDVGRLHSADMFKKGYFAHYDPEGNDVADRAESFGVRFLVIGENLAYAPSLELAHRGLMNSPGHKANILSEDYRKIGIGVASSEEFGIMFTQVFSN